MFQRLRLWLVGQSGLKQATREAAREATREGLLEGIQLGLEDALESLATLTGPPVETIETTTPIPSAAELKGMRKAELLDVAATQGIDADESMTVADLRERLSAVE